MSPSGKKSSGLVTSPARRMFKIGGLVGRVGASVLSERALELVLKGPAKDRRRLENLIENAARIAETLGEMKGAAMKVGQMLSLYEGLLPPEAAAVLRSLQKQAPQVPPEVMRYEVEGSLKAPIGELFAEFDETAYAAASIGQVHRARTPDGRAVAVKVQYPLIREVVTADLDNLKTLFKSLFALIFSADFEPLWQEMRDRLLEELDYEHEAENMRRLHYLHEGVPEIVIPQVVDELTSDRVLTMERIDGIAADEACSERWPQEMRNRWGRVLFEFQIRGLLEHRLLHCDPNLANFAFREDGRVVVYDFGSVKKIPEFIATGYARILLAGIENRCDRVPQALFDLGLYKGKGEPLAEELIEPYFELLTEVLREDPPYRFGEQEGLYQRFMELGAANWSQSMDLHFPEDVIFIDRSLAGHLGNLIRLGASGPWREIVERYARRAVR